MRVVSGRTGVVTGAAGGIGRALAHEFARAGMHMVLADVDEPGLTSLARELHDAGHRALCVKTDVRELAELERLLERTLSEFGHCHLAINNAGVFHAAPLIEAAPRQWQRVIDINLWGVIHGCRVFGRHFVAQREGHIVNTASAAGFFPTPGMSAYSTTKFAVVALSRQLRWELASEGVGVTVLCPGVIKTGIANAPEVGLEHLDMQQVMHRSPGPEGLAKRALRAVQRNKPLVRYGSDSYLFSALGHLPGWLVDPLGKQLAKTTLRVLRGEIPVPGTKRG